ncbi:MAG TPA: xanthine dehydrogenase family protein subunit M [Vicinamibacterales bacterium]|nr:xanthine dehydrogenase family protein subunit M [Acidobacteriota bacterium]HOC19725.1 xanthine dehydrogenase family protein subunit M [Vicinamibacterales bacterium]
MVPSFTYVRAKSVADLVRQLAAPGARVHAGGTDLMGCLRDGVFKADKLVSLSGLADLKGIAAATGGGLRIGALTTNSEVAANPVIVERYPGLAQAARAVASPQLRNQGTIGGNLCQKPRCWYYRGEFHCLRKGGDMCYAVGGENQYHCIFGGDACFIVHPSDTAPALTALEARVRVAGPGGSRVVPIGQFFVLPAKDPTRETVLERNEVVTEILLPPAETGLRSSYRKVRGRGAWDFALAGVALALLMRDGTIERARVVLSGAAPVPWRAQAAEKALVGKAITPETAAAAAEAAMQGAEPMAKNGYKVPMFKGAIVESLLALA